MVLERTSVGLDVHARSIVAGVIDGHAGEIWSQRLAPVTKAVVAWVLRLPGPVAVAYGAARPGLGSRGRWRRWGAVRGGGCVQRLNPGNRHREPA
jgi:hypothetical protein